MSSPEKRKKNAAEKRKKNAAEKKPTA